MTGEIVIVEKIPVLKKTLPFQRATGGARVVLGQHIPCQAPSTERPVEFNNHLISWCDRVDQKTQPTESLFHSEATFKRFVFKVVVGLLLFLKTPFVQNKSRLSLRKRWAILRCEQ